MLRILNSENIDITDRIIQELTKPSRQIGLYIKFANGLELTGKQIIRLEIEEHIITADKFLFGSACSTVTDIEIDNIGEKYNYKDFLNIELAIYFTLEIDGELIKIPMGIFVADSSQKKDSKIILECYDRIYLTGINYDKKTELVYPVTLRDIAIDACQISRVYLSSKPFFNQDLKLDEKVLFGAETTCRNVLQNVAELACGYVRADRYGNVLILQLSDTPVYRINKENSKKFNFDEQKFGPIKSCYVVYEDKDDICGEGSPQFQIRNNYFTPKNINGFASKMFENIKNITYNPLEIEYQGNPLLEAGDFIEIENKKGEIVKSLITSQKFSYNGGLKCTLKSVGKTDLALATEKNVISETIDGLYRRVNNLSKIIDKAKIDLIMNQIDEFTDRVDGLEKEVKEVQINITPDGIVNTVTNSKEYGDVIGGLTDGLGNLSGQIVNAESNITQHADQINMSVKEGNVISSINLDKSGVKISGEKIELKGMVTFSDLAESGKTIINGDNIISGTIQGSKFKGDVFDVMAELNVNPAQEPTFGSNNGWLKSYPDPNNAGEWAKMVYKINLKNNENGDIFPYSDVTMGVFPYGNSINGDLPSNPADWKFGLEISGAIKAYDNVYIGGPDGLVVESEKGITTKNLKTTTIKNLNAIYSKSLYSSNIPNDPFIYFDSQDMNQNRDVIETFLKSHTSVKVSSFNPTKYVGLEANTIKIPETGNDECPYGGHQNQSSKLYTDYKLELLSNPNSFIKYADFTAGNIYTSGYYSPGKNPNGGDGYGTFLLPIRKKNLSPQNVHISAYNNSDNKQCAVQTLFSGESYKNDKTHQYLIGGTIQVGSSQITVGSTKYYYAFVEVSCAMKLTELNSNEKLVVVVGSGTPGSNAWWDSGYSSSYIIRVLSDKPDTKINYIVYTQTEETQFANLKY